MASTAYRLLESAGIVIKRARGRYLYTADGRRILDMCLDGGRLVLGRKTGKSQLVFKNLLEQGAVSSFPSVQQHRFERAVVRSLAADKVLPANAVCIGGDGTSFMAVSGSHVAAGSGGQVFAAVRCYRTYRELCAALLSFGGNPADGAAMLYTWMPFLPDDTAVPPALSVPNPLPLAEAPYTGLFTVDGTYDEAAGRFSALPESGDFSPAVLGASARAFDDLCSSLHEYTEADWAAYDTFLLKYWKRSGAWLYPAVPETGYPAFVSACLQKNILISPEYNVPSVVPLGAGTGELRKL